MLPDPEYHSSAEPRVLVFMPNSKDAFSTVEILKNSHISCHICTTLQMVCDEIKKGADTAILTEELLLSDRTGILHKTLQEEPAWSDFPLLVLTPAGRSSAASIKTLEAIGHMTLLQRPVQIAELLSAARSSLRDRQRQYKVRNHLIERDKQEEALRLADRRKDDFLAILAHELRNPLAPISNALPILQSPKASKEMRFEAMDIVVRQVKQLIRLVDDLMDVSRIRGGKIELRRERIKLRDAIENAVETSRPIIDEHKHTLTINLPDAFVYVNADLLRLSQVISNLLNNAAKYTEPGGHIWLSLEQVGSQAVIHVRDSGIGIAQDMLPRIFDMFTQVDGSLERAQGGIGIGLMLVKNLVEMHDGTIAVASDGAGKGSLFTVRLPLAAAEKATLKPAEQKHEMQSSGQTPSRRILLVEDYKVLAQMTSWALELEGYEVQVAQDGPTAIELAKSYLPEVVMLDIGLPGMNGYELCEAMRKDPVLKNSIFIAQTGWGQEEHRQRSKEAGFHYHMVKPIDPKALRAILAPLKEAHDIKLKAGNG